jgi:methionine-rich copper-binding protein CopC
LELLPHSALTPLPARLSLEFGDSLSVNFSINNNAVQNGKSKVSNRSTRTQNRREKDLSRQLKTNQILSNFGKLTEEKV